MAGRDRRQGRREYRQEDREQFGRRGTAKRYKMRIGTGLRM